MPPSRTSKDKRKKRKLSSIDRRIEEQRAEDAWANDMVKLKQEEEAADAYYGPDGTTEADL
jgi:hypothetical protein